MTVTRYTFAGFVYESLGDSTRFQEGRAPHAYI